MTLGKFVEISLGVNDLAESQLFFERLGFQKLDQNWDPWPWTVLTDGLVTLNLSEYGGASEPVLNYLASDMTERIERISKLGVDVVPIHERNLPEVEGVLETPEGIGVSLVNYAARRIPAPLGRSSSKCGEFGELAFPVRDLEASVEFWRKIGFEELSRARLPYPWAVLSDRLTTLGLHQSEDLDRPAFIYYAEDIQERIEQLEMEGFRFSEELPSPDVRSGRYACDTPDSQIRLIIQRPPVWRR